MDRKAFLAESARALALIDERLGRLELEGVDVELAGDVLTISFERGADFIINAHSGAGQIWMAAGSQAWHFDLVVTEGTPRWISSRGGDELLHTLAHELGRRLARTVEL